MSSAPPAAANLRAPSTNPGPSRGTSPARFRLDPSALWVLISAWAALAGWLLSALHQLNRAGWTGSLILLMGLLWMANQSGWVDLFSPGKVRVNWRRFRRPLPALFAGVALLSLVGGASAPPNNYDGLTYRLPRTLHWLAENQWHWISTPEARMNFSGTGFEWLQTALFSLTNSDRQLFLINLIPFLMLPGLIFAVFRQLGCAGRVARFWMWFLPLTYGIALQAGSIANDAFAGFYALAAVHFALRAGQSQKPGNLWLCLFAAACLSAIKASNLPLLLPIMIAMWPARGVIQRHAIQTALAALVAIPISFLPIAFANQQHTGHWTGDPDNSQGIRLQNPVAGVIGNATMLLAQSSTLPALPSAQKLTTVLNDHLPEFFKDGLHGGYPRFCIVLTELPQEESSGVGVGCVLLLLATAAISVCKFKRYAAWLQRTSPQERLGLGVAGGAMIALLFCMAKLGSEYPARLLTPYVPLMVLPAALSPMASQLERQRWWRWIALPAAATTLCVLLISPARPILPMEQLVDAALTQQPGSKLLQRAHAVYSTYRARHDMLGPARKHLPAEATRIGLCGGGDESEMSLWRPYGRRRVERLSPDDLLSHRWHGLEWVVLKSNGLNDVQRDLGTLTNELGVTLVASEHITSKLARGPEKWLVLQLPTVGEVSRKH